MHRTQDARELLPWLAHPSQGCEGIPAFAGIHGVLKSIVVHNAIRTRVVVFRLRGSPSKGHTIDVGDFNHLQFH